MGRRVEHSLASIYIENYDITIQASPAVSILNNLLRNGIAISHVCGGKALCGTCQYTILSGGDGLSPKAAVEKQKLAALGNPPDMRLACQSYSRSDLSIRIRFEKPPDHYEGN